MQFSVRGSSQALGDGEPLHQMLWPGFLNIPAEELGDKTLELIDYIHTAGRKEKGGSLQE